MITAATRAANRQRESIGMTHRQCPVCASLHLEYEFLVDRSPVCGCQTCGLLFLNPAPEDTVDQNDPLSLQPKKFSDLYEANAAERIQELIQYSGCSQGRLLLIGGDDYHTAKATQQGFETFPIPLLTFKSLNEADLPARIELCILFCSLERMQDPLERLQLLRRVLGEHGALMVVAPTTDSRAARIFRSSWWEFNRNNHFYFSIDTLQSLLIRSGFGDPIITPDRTLVSVKYLRSRLSSIPRSGRNLKLLRGIASLTPVIGGKTFHSEHSRTRFLVRSKKTAPVPLLSVIVPVYNEKATFVEMMDQLLAKSIRGVEIEIIIVESNSTDGTRTQVQKYANHERVRLILQEKARGKGNAVRAGLAIAKGDIILFQDADLEYDFNDYESLISPILRFESNFVLGSRHSAAAANWKIRNFSDSPGLSTVFNLGHLVFLTMFNLLYSQRLSDPFTMFKVFRRDCIWGLSFECNRFDFDFEIVIKLLRKGYKPLELPVNYTSRSVNEGKKVTMFRDPLTWLRALAKFRKVPLYKRPVA